VNRYLGGVRFIAMP